MSRSKIIYLGLILTVAGCSKQAAFELEVRAKSQCCTSGHRKTEEFEHLPNMLRVTESIFSGAEPEGVEGFAELAQLGIRTVVSVDGAIPRTELAKAYQLQYVHIPIGYGDVSEVAGKMLAALPRTENGPFYIHCHHGKHRGPTAAAIVCIASGAADAEGALAILKKAGTSKKYVGLWEAVRHYKPPPENEQLPTLVEIAKLDSMATAMAHVDRQYDYLKLCQSVHWKTPPTHPDLTPVQQALLLQESFRELRRSLGEDRDGGFRESMGESEGLSNKLLDELSSAEPTATLDATFKKLGEQCQHCHSKWRN